MKEGIRNSNSEIQKYTALINHHVDIINRHIQDVSDHEKDQQIAYILTRMDYLKKRFDSILIKPGKNKSYQHEVRHATNTIEQIIREVELWQNRGVLPDYLEELLTLKGE